MAGDGEWQDLYLKIALLWVDKPSFVRALIYSDYKPKSNHPSMLHVLGVSWILVVAMWIYAVMFVATSSYDKKPWDHLGPINSCAGVIIGVISPAYFIAKYQLWQSPMTVKARISAMPPPVRDQGDDHAKTMLTRVVYVGGSAFVAIGAVVFSFIGSPVADMLAALFVRDTTLALVEKWAANKVAIAQAEAVILGLLGSSVQFADNVAGDIVVRPSALKALRWQDEKIRQDMEEAVRSFPVKLTIFDLDCCQPSVIEHKGPTLVPVSTDLDLKALAAMGLQRAGQEVWASVKDTVMEKGAEAVEGI